MLAGERCLLRAYRADDVGSLPSVAGDWSVVRWMNATFPHPYTPGDARAWVAKASIEDPTDNFAIEVDGALAGGIGLRPLAGESLGVAEFGYWLGQRSWGRGLATEAARLLVRYAFRVRGLRRLEAYVFAPNFASARVVEKSGFRREAILREAIVDREGAVMDAWLYAQLRSEATVT